MFLRNLFFSFIIFTNLISGCKLYNSFYQVNTVPLQNSNTLIEQMQKRGKYLILHFGDQVMHLKDAIFNSDSMTIRGVIEELPNNHLYYKSTKPKGYGSNWYKPKMGAPTLEVHIHISVFSDKKNSLIHFPISSIYKIEVYDFSEGATIASYVYSTIGMGIVSIVTFYFALVVIVLIMFQGF